MNIPVEKVIDRAYLDTEVETSKALLALEEPSQVTLPLSILKQWVREHVAVLESVRNCVLCSGTGRGSGEYHGLPCPYCAAARRALEASAEWTIEAQGSPQIT